MPANAEAAGAATPPEPRRVRQIVLVGLSGVGKSSVGAELAARFGWPLLDTDDLVRERTGQTPAQLITGKPAFPPVEGLEKQMWDTQCVSCHSWTKTALCDQAKTYQANDVSIMRLPHPLGPRFKVALQKWAENGCR